MIPRVYYALSLLLFLCTPMTTANATTSSGTNVFNLSLKDEAGKSTVSGPFAGQYLAFVTPITPISLVTPPTSASAALARDRFAISFGTQRCTEATPSYTAFPSVERRSCNDRRATSFKIVLDAGHGGKDPGGMGKNSHEKAIALKITQLLAIGIRTNFPNVEVIMTRSDDTFIPLYERARIANDAGADLFVSIHANIMPGSSATFGTETFVMGQHVAKHNLAVAKRENASILLEDNVQKNYGYDPNSDEGHIMMSTFQHAFLERSILFADLVESEFKNSGRKSRGVKQAGFVVLKETTMPAVLVETGFMSNPNEEAYLLSGTGQQKLANAILKAFAVYYKRLDSNASFSPFAVPSAPATAAVLPPVRAKSPKKVTPSTISKPIVNVFSREVPSSTPPTPARRKQWTARGVSPTPITYRSPQPVSSQALPSPASAPQQIYRGQPVAYGTPLPVDRYQQAVAPRNQELTNLLSREVTNSLQTQPSAYEQARRVPLPVAVKPPADTTPYQFKKAKTVPSPPSPRGIDLDKVPDSQLLYAIQLIASKRELDLNSLPWRNIPYPIRKIREGDLNKYQIRNLATAQEAKTAQLKAKAAGLNEAMLVVYYRGKRLPPHSVKYLLAR